MIFTLTSHVLDTLLVKTTGFIIGQTYNVISWGGYQIYYYYCPPPDSKEIVLEKKINDLEHRLKLLTNDFESEYIIVDNNN